MCSTDSVEFMFLLWLTHLPALGVRQIAQSACIFSPAMNANGGMGSAGQDSRALVLPALYPARISASSSLLAATMNRKSSLREVPRFVSWAMTGNTFFRLQSLPT